MIKQVLAALWERGVVWAKQKPYLATTLGAVLLIHLAALLWVMVTLPIGKIAVPKNSITVRTREAAPLPESSMTASNVSYPLKPSPVPKAKVIPPAPQVQAPPLPKPVAAKKPANKKPAEKKVVAKPTPAQSPPPAVLPDAVDPQNDLLQQLEQSLNALKEMAPPSTLAPTKSPARALTALNIDDSSLLSPAASATRASDAPALGYRDELVTRLRLLLRLPEYGTVRLSLSLGRDGHVKAVTILSSESMRNRDYVEKTIPDIVFPSFGTHFEGEETHLFTLTLSNDM